MVKHHPASVDLELVKRLALITSASTVQAFLHKEFACISKDYAGGASCRPTVLCIQTTSCCVAIHGQIMLIDFGLLVTACVLLNVASGEQSKSAYHLLLLVDA